MNTSPSLTLSALLAARVAAGFEPPFYDREPVLNSIRRFIESSASICLVLAGMRGIGKTSLAREVFKKVLPPTWHNIWVPFTEGIAYHRLLADIAHRCGIRTPADFAGSDATRVTISQDVLLYLSVTPRVVLVLDDVQHALDPSGEFTETTIADFLRDAITRSAQNRNKIILITTNVPRFPVQLHDSIEVKYLTGLERGDAENLLSFWYHFEREDLRGQPIDFPDTLFRVLAGHPLGLRIAAKMWAENPFDQAELALFKRLREAVVAYILDRVNLTPREEEFIKFASVFRLPVSRDVFLRWKKDEANFLMDSFIGRSFLEAEADRYQLHPLIREHFYNSTGAPVLQPYHRLAGQFFLDSYTIAKAGGGDPEPEAEDYFQRAIEADENNAFVYVTYSRFLLHQGRYEDGLGYALAAVEVNPRDYRNRELVKELRQRIQRAQSERAS